MDKVAIIFTMKGCPHCTILKEMLDKENIDYVDRDIEEFEEEYDLFVEATGSEYVPAFMLIEGVDLETPKSTLHVPDRDFQDIDEGVNLIREFYQK